LSEAIERFKRACPNVDLLVQSDHADRIQDALLHGELDMLCTLAPGLAHAEDIEKIVIYKEHPSALLPLNHPLAGHKTIAVEELRGERLLMHSRKKSTYMYDALCAIFTKAGFEPNVCATEDNDGVGVMRVMSGEAVGIYPTDWSVPSGASRREIPAGAVFVHLECDNTPFARVLAWRKDNRNPARQQFVRIIRELSQNSGNLD
ncbi:MAG: LysR family substrate-binding domain-containing protein, partial [Clostridia bacterium]|nr:LysR family substrate-binding domain-containing protein [Clostridia bacterium]